MSLTPLRIVAILAAGIVMTLVLHYVRNFPWKLAGLVGGAVAILVWVTFNTGDRLKSTWRR